MNSKDVLFLIAFMVSLLIVSVTGSLLFGKVAGLSMTLIFGFFILAMLLLNNLRRLQKKILDQSNTLHRIISNAHEVTDSKTDSSYHQIEALIGLRSYLEIDRILPPFREWAISPDFASELVLLLDDHKPKKIIECGCGISTLIISYWLKKIGCGYLVTLEHDSEYKQKIDLALDKHGLRDYATVVLAPLKKYTINDEEWRWYDISAIEGSNGFDFIVIDGPPKTTDKMARYPSFPLMHERMADEYVVVLDDYNRQDEMKIVELWIKEYQVTRKIDLVAEKGACALIVNK